MTEDAEEVTVMVADSVPAQRAVLILVLACTLQHREADVLRCIRNLVQQKNINALKVVL